MDSREVEPGDFFIALPGSRTDGHRYLGEAFQNGAVGAMVQSEEKVGEELQNLLVVEDTIQGLHDLASFYRAQLSGTLVGITGSWGKTTTKELLGSIFSTDETSYRSPGNYNTEFGLPVALLNMPENSAYGVFELGAQHPGDIGKLSDILRPDMALITGLGRAHVKHFSSMDELRSEKADVVKGMDPGTTVLLNGDVSALREISLDDHKVAYYGSEAGEDLDYKGLDIDTMGRRGAEFLFQGPRQEFKLRIDLIGRQNMQNAVGATSAALINGIPPEAISKGLRIDPLPHRLQPREFSRGLVIDDTYNANPDAVKASLELLSEWELDGERVAVLGDMLELGSLAREAHRGVANSIIDSGINRVYGYGELTRFLVKELKDLGFSGSAENYQDLQALNGSLGRRLSGEGNVVLVKGSRETRMERVVEFLQAL